MKMRKLLSTVVAGAIAASAMMISSSAATETITMWEATSYNNVRGYLTFSFMETEFKVGDSLTLKIPAEVGVDNGDGSGQWLGLYTKGDSAYINGVKAGGDVTSGITVDFGVSNKAATANSSATISAGKRTSIAVYFELKWQSDEAKFADNGNYSWASTAIDTLASQNDKATMSFYSETLGMSGTDNDTVIGMYDRFAAVSKSAAGSSGTLTRRLTIKEQTLIQQATSARVKITLASTNTWSALPYITVSLNDTDWKTPIVIKNLGVVETEVPVDQLFNVNYGTLTPNFNVDVSASEWNSVTKLELILSGDAIVSSTTDEDPATTDEDPNAAEDDNDDDTDLTDDDDDDDDDIDVDFGDDDDDDDDDNTDFGTGDVTTDTSNAATGDGSDAAGAGTVTSGDTTATGSNPKTGVAVAVIPAIVAAAAVVVARKRK